jgi:hypothetical protein
MKNAFKLFGVIAFIAIIAFVFFACDNSTPDPCESGHTFPATWTEVDPATATTNGSEELKCTVCGAHHPDSPRVIPASCFEGHTFTQWEVTQLATCEEEGVETQKCSVCGTLGTTTRPIDKLQHTFVGGKCTACGATDPEYWTMVSAGRTHSLGIRGGRLYAWGDPGSGRLGNGSMIGDVTTPTQIGEYTDWEYISAHTTQFSAHSLGIKDGRLYAWGTAANGRLGNGIITPDVPVPTLITVP